MKDQVELSGGKIKLVYVFCVEFPMVPSLFFFFFLCVFFFFFFFFFWYSFWTDIDFVASVEIRTASSCIFSSSCLSFWLQLSNIVSVYSITGL